MGDDSLGIYERSGGAANKAPRSFGCKGRRNYGGLPHTKAGSQTKAGQRKGEATYSARSGAGGGLSGASGRTEGGGTSPSDRCCCKPMRGQMHRSPAEKTGVQPSAQVPKPDNNFNGCQGSSIEKQHDAEWSQQGAPFATFAALNSVSSTEARELFPKGEDLMTFSFSFATWCMSLTRWVLKSRTGFGHYLSTTLSLTRDGPDAPLPPCFLCRCQFLGHTQSALRSLQEVQLRILLWTELCML